MADVQKEAEDSPGPEEGAAAAEGLVEAEDADGGIVHAVEDAGSGGEVVELFGDGEITGVKDGAEDPACDADTGEPLVPGTERIGGGDMGADFAQTLAMSPEVAEGEEDGEGFLDAE